MKKMYTLLFLSLVSIAGWGQMLFHEPFNYPADPVNGIYNQSAGIWERVNTGDSVLVETGNLSYPGLQASTGNKIKFEGAGADYYRIFSSQSSGIVYTSFILNVTNLGGLNTTGGYFTSLIAENSTSLFGASIWLRLSSTAGKYNIGIAPRTTATTINWLPAELDITTSYFIASSYELISGTANDVVKLWLNPTSLGVAAPAPDATVDNTGGTDLTSLERFLIRQSAANQTPFIEMDEIRVGLSWADVTPAAATVAAPTTTSIAPSSAVAGGSAFTITVNGTNFIDGQSTVTWNGSNRATAFVNANQLTASITAADIAAAGTAAVGVTTTGAASPSNTQTFTIDPPATPLLSATAPAPFGPVCINNTAANQSFTITGSSLNAGNITVGPLAGYRFATTSGGPFIADLTIPTAGGNFSQTVFVQFTPTAVQSYDGNIAVSGGGANAINVAVSGSGINTTATVISGTTTAITNSGATLQGNITAAGCGTVSAYGFEYSTTSGFANGTGTQVPSTNLSSGSFTADLTGLNSNTTYYFKSFVTSSAGTSFSAEGSFSTTGAIPSAPVATTATNISSSGFTANWNAVAGATSYFLDVYTLGASADTVAGWNTSFNNASSQVADEGNSNNLGIQNITGVGLNVISYPGGPTGSSGVNAYSVSANGWDNGADTKYWQVGLNTTGVTGMTVSSLQGSSNTGPANFKIQYKIGTGGAWTDVPNGTVTITTPPSPGNPATFFGPSDLPLPSVVNNQPEVFIRWLMTSLTSVNGATVVSGGTSRIAAIYIKSAGSGTAPVYVTGYQNLNVGNVTSHAVTGLNPTTNYYYVVRATNASGISASSNEIAVSTIAGPLPSLSATTLVDFGSVTVGQNSTAQTFDLSGINLTGAPGSITVNAPSADFQVSSDNINWSSSTTVAYTSSTLAATQVYVRFTPQSSGLKSGNIAVAGGGATISVAVSGTGINPLPPVAPVAIAATNISSNGFTANWNAVAGATAYLLDVYTMGTGSGSSTIAGWNFSFNNSSSDVADAGNTNNIGIQTVSGIGLNTISYPGGPTGSSGVNPYSISANGWDNGADTKYWQINLNATGVTGLSLSSLQGSSNTGPAAFKIQYRVGASGTWTDVPGGTVTITVVPSPGNPATFFGPTDLPLPSAVDNQPNVSVRWLQTSNTAVNGSAIASNGTSRISAIYVKGNSAGSVPVFVPGYQNLNVGNVTSYNVTGLAPNTNYYYVVRATNAAGTSVNSNEINVVTAPDLNPNLNATALTAFGNVCINTIAGPHSFTITGSNLTPGDITVAAVTGYSFSTTANGVYAPTLNISQPGGSFSQQVFVRFNPTAVQNYNGSIGISGGGVANPAQVAVTGAGINSLPGVSTGSASNIGLNAATVAGSITANGCSAISAYGIEYSTVNNFAPGTGTQVTSGNLSGSNFTSVLSGLTLNTLYYYRAFATNGAGTAYGPQQSFTTLATPPVTLTATALTAFGNICANTISDPLSFTLTGSNLTNANVVVGPLSGYSFSTTAGGNYTPSISIAQPGGAFSQQVFVRLNPTVAQSFNGNIPVSGGGSTAFTVIASGTGVVTPPSVTTGNAVNVTTSSAVLNGTLNAPGCSAVTTYGIEYSGVPGFIAGTGTQVAASNLAGTNFSVTLNALVQGNLYYYRAFARNAGAIAFGDEVQLVVMAIPDAFTIYPVPADRGSVIYFSMNGLKQGYHGLRIFNSAGQEVYRKDMNVQGGFINENLRLPFTLAPGIYRVRLNNDTEMISTKTIVIL